VEESVKNWRFSNNISLYFENDKHTTIAVIEDD